MGASGTVQSVLGPVAAADLGRTLIHEHLFFGPEYGPLTTPPPPNGPTDMAVLTDLIAAELHAAHEQVGLGCLVDVTPTACNRNPQLQRTLNGRSGVAVIAATGFWVGDSYPEWAGTASIDELCAHMTSELEQGMQGTGVRAGVVKVATSDGGITAAEARALRAAARVQRALGPAIITHTGRLAAMAWEQLGIFAQEGADLDRVVIGHLDGQTDLHYCEYLLERGATIAFDRVGRGAEQGQPEIAEKADLVVALVQQGWSERILIAHDAGRWFWTSAGFGPGQPPYTYAFTTFADLLRERGVRDEQLATIFIDNPRRVLCH